MRKALVILALTMVTVAASAGDAFAQRRGGGYGGGRGGYGGGSGWGISIGNGGSRFYSGDNYNRGYYDRGNYGSNYYGSRYNSMPYYYGSQYYYADPIVQVPSTRIQQSFYSEPASSQQVATMVVHLPRADAKVWFDGAMTSQQGMERSYYSPPLAPNGTYSYTIRARWMENGQTVERERRVNVQPGQSVHVDFRGDSGETLQTPPRPK